MRYIALDAHRAFCEVAAWEDGAVRSWGRVASTVEALERFAGGLERDDVVVLEATYHATVISRLLAPSVARVLVVDARQARAAIGGRAKTDRLDARALARLAAAGLLQEVWVPDEPARIRRRLVLRRAQLARQRIRERHQLSAVLHRNLLHPPVTDVLGRDGRAWLAELELAFDDRLTLDGCLRHIALLDDELRRIERELARLTLADPDARRLLTVPGISAVTASALLGAIGDVRRFPKPAQLVAYLGLDPRVAQSGSQPARHGRISKQGPSEVRRLLVEAALNVIRTPGPLRAFHQRVAARRGNKIATVAVARKLVVIVWHLLHDSEDYAFGRPSLTREKLRSLELLCGAPHRRPADPRVRATPQERELERQLSDQLEHAYRQLTNDWQAQRPSKRSAGAGAATGRAFSGQPTATSPRGNS